MRKQITAKFRDVRSGFSNGQASKPQRRTEIHLLFKSFKGLHSPSTNQSINQSSFISGMTERRPEIHKSNRHSNSSRVMCLIFVFIKHSCNKVGV